MKNDSRIDFYDVLDKEIGYTNSVDSQALAIERSIREARFHIEMYKGSFLKTRIFDTFQQVMVAFHGRCIPLLHLELGVGQSLENEY